MLGCVGDECNYYVYTSSIICEADVDGPIIKNCDRNKAEASEGRCEVRVWDSNVVSEWVGAEDCADYWMSAV